MGWAEEGKPSKWNFMSSWIIWYLVRRPEKRRRSVSVGSLPKMIR